MAVSTEGNQIRKRVGFPVTLKAEFPERLNVCYRQLFLQLASILFTVLTYMIISMSCLIALLSPVRAIIWILSTFPVRAIFTAKMICEPFETTGVTTKSFCCRASRNGSCFPALLADIHNAIGLARTGAVNPLRIYRGLHVKHLAALRTYLFDLPSKCLVSASARAVHLIGVASARDYIFSANRTCFHAGIIPYLH